MCLKATLIRSFLDGGVFVPGMSGLTDDGGCHMWEQLSSSGLVPGSEYLMLITTWSFAQGIE